MLTTNTTKVKAKEDDGKRRVISTSKMPPIAPRHYRREFPGVQKRETNKIDPSAKFNTTELDHLMKTIGYKPVVKAERAPAPAIKTPQPKPAKKTTVKKATAKKRKG